MKVGAENINPYSGDSRDKREQVRDMFDNIAPAYDFMNRMMTMGVDKLWRRKAVKMIKRSLRTLSSEVRPHILDVATGTGDLALALARQFPNAKITGIDLSEGMLEIGRRKVKQANLNDRVTLVAGDCLEMPFADNTFHCITVAYGVRNFQRLSDGYKEMCRVLKPGGMLCVIELSTPTSHIVKPLYNLYTHYVIPTVGHIVSKDVSAYKYLPESIAAVAQGSEMTSLIEECGLTKAAYLPLTFGVCTIYTAYKSPLNNFHKN